MILCLLLTPNLVFLFTHICFNSCAYDRSISFFHFPLNDWHFRAFINNTASIPPHFDPDFLSLLHKRRKAQKRGMAGFGRRCLQVDHNGGNFLRFWVV